jgi:hypothetical protein
MRSLAGKCLMLRPNRTQWRSAILFVRPPFEPRPAQSAAPTARPFVEKQCLTPLLYPSQWL